MTLAKKVTTHFFVVGLLILVAMILGFIFVDVLDYVMGNWDKSDSKQYMQHRNYQSPEQRKKELDRAYRAMKVNPSNNFTYAGAGADTKQGEIK